MHYGCLRLVANRQAAFKASFFLTRQKFIKCITFLIEGKLKKHKPELTKYRVNDGLKYLVRSGASVT
jgi:hypothetical protein